MIDIPIQAIANQQLSIPLDGHRFVLTLKEASGGMVCTVERDGDIILQNQRLTGDNFVLPYNYLHSGLGNFFVFTQSEELPWWEQFGVTQFMVYATAEEIAAAVSNFNLDDAGPLTYTTNILMLDGSWFLNGSFALNGHVRT